MTTRVRVCEQGRTGPSDAWRHGAFIHTMACDNIVYKAKLRRVMKYTYTRSCKRIRTLKDIQTHTFII